MNLNLTTATRIGLNVLALLGLAVALYLGKSIFIPLILAALLAVILYPAAGWLNRHGIRWFMACLLVILGLIVVNLTVFVGFTTSITRVLQDLPKPDDEEGQKKFYLDIRRQVQSITPGSIEAVLPANPDQSQIFQQIRNSLKPESLRGPLWELSLGGISWLWQSILTLFILLFLLMEGDMLAQRVREIFPANVNIQGRVAGALGEMAEAVRAYLVWRTIVNCGLAVVLGLFYQTLGLRQPWTWALFTAVLCYVPYIGTIIAGLPPALDAFIYTNPWITLFVIVWYIGVVTFEGYIIVPVLMGRKVDLNATTVMIACLFWELVWGIPGLFLAMPLMAGVRAICLHVDGWQAWGKLMSTHRGVEEFEKSEKADRLKLLGERISSTGDTTVVMEEPPSANGHPTESEVLNREQKPAP
jgi:predicted PurR-regulated permease PerM